MSLPEDENHEDFEVSPFDPEDTVKIPAGENPDADFVTQEISLSGTEALFFPDPKGSKAAAKKDLAPEADQHLRDFREIAGTRWDDNRAVVKSYIEDLLKLDNKDQSRRLLDRALKNGAPFTQRLACEALSRLGKSGLRILLRNLIRKDGSPHPDVLQTIGVYGARSIRPILEVLEEFQNRKNSKGELTRAHQKVLMKFLGQFPSLKVSAYLSSFIAENDREMQQIALEGLMRQGLAAERSLLKLLGEKGDYPHVRRNAIYLLGHFRSREAVPLVACCLEDEERVSLQCLEIWALGAIGNYDAFSALQKYLTNHRNILPVVLRALIEAFGRMEAPAGVPLIAPYLEQRELRESAIEALGKIGEARAIPYLKPFLESPVARLRALTVQALAGIGNKEAIQLLLQGVIDPEPYVRHATQCALLELYSEADVEEICARYQESLASKRHGAWQDLLDVAGEDDAFGEAEWDLDEERAPRREAPRRSFWQSAMERINQRMLEVSNRLGKKTPKFPKPSEPFNPFSFDRF